MEAVSRRVQLVLLCEDTQQETFVRRFLIRSGWDTRRLRVEKGHKGGGSAEQFVRERFPCELHAYRSKRAHVAQALIVMLDGDDAGVEERLRSLGDSCRSQKVPVRNARDRVAVFVPTWRIETWIAYLNGEDIDETKRDYPRLNHARDCRTQVDELIRMCRSRTLREPAPPSLKAACVEYDARLVDRAR